MFDEVIVPIDGSAESSLALRPGSAVASYLGVAMRIVAYHSPHDDGVELTRIVQRQAAGTGDVPRKIEVAPMSRPVAELLDDLLEESPGALVVMSTRGHGRTVALIGSVATDVLRTTQRPVMLIGPSCKISRFRLHGAMLVPVDTTETSPSALAVANEMVRDFDFDPVLVEVMDPATAYDMDRARAGPYGAKLTPETSALTTLARTLRWSTDPENVDIEVLRDRHPGKAIAEYAEERHAALITMATHARAGLSRLALGSVTAEVVAHAPCPVLAVAPDRATDMAAGGPTAGASAFPKDQQGLQVLDEDTCWRLVESVAVGRIAFVQNDKPVVLPINHVVHDRSVVFRTAEGSKFDAAILRHPVAFEVDDWSADHRSGWSVLIDGVAMEVVDGARREELDKLDLRPWADEVPRTHWVRIRTQSISGRMTAP